MGQLYKWLLCTYGPNLTTREVLYTSKMCHFNVRYQVIRGPGINQLTPWTYCADIEVRIRKEGGERIVLCARCSFRGVAGHHSPVRKGRRPSSTPDGNLGFPEIFPLKSRLQLTAYGYIRVLHYCLPAYRGETSDCLLTYTKRGERRRQNFFCIQV